MIKPYYIPPQKNLKILSFKNGNWLVKLDSNFSSDETCTVPEKNGPDIP